MSLGAPAAPNFQHAAYQDAQASHPNQSSPFASSQWGMDGNGNWTQQLGLSGALGGAAAGLQGQAAQALSKPMDASLFGPVQDGSAAREQATTSAYNQSTSRLDPQWQQRESQTRTQLLNQGLDPNSEAARGAMSSLGQQRNDAYSSAMAGAQAQGTAAGDSVFRNNLMSQQQAIANALRQRGQPLADMQGLQGLMHMPSAPQGGNNLQAAQAQYGANMDRWQAQQALYGDIFGGFANLGGAAMFAL